MRREDEGRVVADAKKEQARMVKFRDRAAEFLRLVRSGKEKEVDALVVADIPTISRK